MSITVSLCLRLPIVTCADTSEVAMDVMVVRSGRKQKGEDGLMRFIRQKHLDPLSGSKR